MRISAKHHYYLRISSSKVMLHWTPFCPSAHLGRTPTLLDHAFYNLTQSGLNCGLSKPGAHHPGDFLPLLPTGSCASCVHRRIDHEAKKAQRSLCSPFQGPVLTWPEVSCASCKGTCLNRKKKLSPATPSSLFPLCNTALNSCRHLGIRLRS